MNRVLPLSVIIASLLFSATAASAAPEIEQEDSIRIPDIVMRINSSGQACVEMPAQLLQRLVSDVDQTESSRSVNSGGYRIQVFSDSNPRTARDEARAKASNITARFPQWQAYVTYNAPYWRVRVGDFISLQSAQDALADLKDAFPAYKRELRIVRDNINR